MAELKPCPFCGGNARISADIEAWNRRAEDGNE